MQQLLIKKCIYTYVQSVHLTVKLLFKSYRDGKLGTRNEI